MNSVTVLVPNYNRAAFLPECLGSIRAQTFKDWQVIVGDDGSNDDSIDVLRSLADRRIRIVRRERNVGWATNSNLLLEEADSEYVAFLHSDDWWEPTFLSRLVDLLDRTPNALVGTAAARVWSQSGMRVMGPHRAWPWQAGTECPSPQALQILMRRNRIVTPSMVLARRELYRRYPRFEAFMPNVCDWLMWIRAVAAGSLVVCAEALTNYRQHRSSMSGEAKRSNRYGEQFVQMAQLLQDEWSGEREPFSGAVNELTTLITIRLMADALLRHEEGDRSGAILLAGMARDIAPAAGLRVLAGAVRRTIGHSSPSGVRRLRVFATRVGRLLIGEDPPSVKVGRRRSRHYLFGLVDDLRDDLRQHDPKLGPSVSPAEITDASRPPGRAVGGTVGGGSR